MTEDLDRLLEGFDLGSGHRWLWDREPNGLWHDGVCRSWHSVRFSGRYHRIASGGRGDEGRLTIEGSLICTRSGQHGYIRNGRWENAS